MAKNDDCLTYVNDKNKIVHKANSDSVAILIKHLGNIALDSTSQTWYRYDDKLGYYKEIEDFEFDVHLQDITKQLSIGKGYSTKYHYDNKTLITPRLMKKMDASTDLLCFNNCVLNVQTKEVLNHSPIYNFTKSLPFDYQPKLPPPKKFIDFLNFATNYKEDQIQMLRAFINCVIVGRNDLQRYLELIGSGGTGKSTFINILIKLIGKHNCHVTRFDLLETNRFESASYYNKKLIVINEAEQYQGKVSQFKSVIGGDAIRYENKFIRLKSNSSFEYKGMVAVIANDDIQSSDYSSGIQRRKLAVKFNNKVCVNSIKDMDKYLDDELPAILNWALELTHDDVTNYILKTDLYVPSLRQNKLESLGTTNSVAGWMLDNCSWLKGAKTQIGVANEINASKEIDNMQCTVKTYENVEKWLYPNYCNWCRQNNQKPIANKSFSKVILDIGKNQLNLELNKIKDSTGNYIENIALKTITTNSINDYVLKQLNDINNETKPKQKIENVQEKTIDNLLGTIKNDLLTNYDKFTAITQCLDIIENNNELKTLEIKEFYKKQNEKIEKNGYTKWFNENNK